MKMLSRSKPVALIFALGFVVVGGVSWLHFAVAAGVFGPAATDTETTVLLSDIPKMVAPPGSEINIQSNFRTSSPMHDDDSLEIFLLNAQGAEVASEKNDLNNSHTSLPTTTWSGPVSFLSVMTLPKLHDGTYTIAVSLNKVTGPVQLTPGPGVIQGSRFRYAIGTLQIASSASAPPLLPSPSLDLSGYRLTFEESFKTMSISDSADNDGARWYARNEECCMSTTDGSATAMVGVSSPQNPFALIPGGGLDIRLHKASNAWTSGVLTTVDRSGKGFSQQYGYFEMKAKFPPGEDTWPAFWLLNTASKSGSAPAGEIDVVEYVANHNFKNYIATTLHDWSNKTAPAASHYRVELPSDGFHTYGLMWTATTMTFYFDGAVTMRCPTPSIMKQPYYMLVDLGVGSGWPTENTPATNDMQIQYVRAYASAKS